MNYYDTFCFWNFALVSGSIYGKFILYPVQFSFYILLLLTFALLTELTLCLS